MIAQLHALNVWASYIALHYQEFYLVKFFGIALGASLDLNSPVIVEQRS
jgi:hypothetical protein